MSSSTESTPILGRMTVLGSHCECGCGFRVRTVGARYCRGHNPKTDWPRREAHPLFRTGRRQDADGYFVVRVFEDEPIGWAMAHKPNKRGARFVLEHRLVMARYLGRPLERWETVHHIDGDRSNNTIENLQLRIGKHGSGQALRCADCGSSNLIPDELAESSDRPRERG